MRGEGNLGFPRVEWGCPLLESCWEIKVTTKVLLECPLCEIVLPSHSFTVGPDNDQNLGMFSSPIL